MKIETKFNVYQEVFMLFDNKVENVEIKSIEIKVDPRAFDTVDTFIKYILIKHPCGREGYQPLNENELFATKEDLLRSL